MGNLDQQLGRISPLGKLLKQPKAPEIQMPSSPDEVKAPTTDQAAQNQDAMDKLRRRRGRASTILGGADGASSAGTSIGTKTLLGQ